MSRGLGVVWIVTWLGCSGSRARPVPSTEASDSQGFGGFVTIEIDYESELEALDELDRAELAEVATNCSDLESMEPAAVAGKLPDAQITCLLAALDAAERQTVKNRISRLLLHDAWVKGDTHRWAAVAERHLADVDRSDPDLVWQYCWYIVKLGNPERMEEAVYWAEVALENKSVWEGDQHVERVYGLHKFRTTAAFRRWEYLEASYSDVSGLEKQQIVEGARNELKNFAKEWLSYARSAGRDPSEAMRLCQMAAGTEDFCSES